MDESTRVVEEGQRTAHREKKWVNAEPRLGSISDAREMWEFFTRRSHFTEQQDLLYEDSSWILITLPIFIFSLKLVSRIEVREKPFSLEYDVKHKIHLEHKSQQELRRS